MARENKLYSKISDHETILELWNSSDNHPDSTFFFSDFFLSDWEEPKEQIVPWIFECASTLASSKESYLLGKWACDLYEIKE